MPRGRAIGSVPSTSHGGGCLIARGTKNAYFLGLAKWHCFIEGTWNVSTIARFGGTGTGGTGSRRSDTMPCLVFKGDNQELNYIMKVTRSQWSSHSDGLTLGYQEPRMVPYSGSTEAFIDFLRATPHEKHCNGPTWKRVKLDWLSSASQSKNGYNCCLR